MSITHPDAEAADRADMERLCAGDPAGLDALMARHATPVFHFLFRTLGNEDDADDLAQETFVRVFNARNSYRPAEKFTTWLYTIAANLARNQFRWRSRHPTVPLESDDPAEPARVVPAADAGPDQAALDGELNAAVRHAVAELPDDLRAAIVLCEWEERAVAEAATILGTTPKAVESRLYRARQALREQLKKWL